MVSWRVLIDEDAQKFLENLPEKSLRIAKEKLRTLEEDPFPGKHGDKELIQRKGHKDIYRCIFRGLILHFIEFTRMRR